MQDAPASDIRGGPEAPWRTPRTSRPAPSRAPPPDSEGQHEQASQGPVLALARAILSMMVFKIIQVVRQRNALLVPHPVAPHCLIQIIQSGPDYGFGLSHSSKTVRARLWPRLEPFLARKSLNSFNMFPPRSTSECTSRHAPSHAPPSEVWAVCQSASERRGKS